MDRLRGKVAVVTGAGRGIGRAVAVRLAEEGADVVVNHRADEGSAAALVFATNTRGQLFAAQHAARYLGPGGRILLMSSVSAHKAVFHHAVYAASKAAVEAIALNLAPELAQRGITINAIAPGGTKTDMAAAVSHRYRHPALDLDEPTQMRTMAALGRLATAQEIAAAAVFLVSPDAAYLTGATIPVNGGFF